MPPRRPKSLSYKGRALLVNDHVLVSTPFAGEPYLIARILELLPAIVPDSHASTSTPTPTGPRLRVACYLRPRDISNRYLSDSRLILATMHVDVILASKVRGICTVKHRDQVKDMESYKREPDSFYFHQLYDRYLHSYFDVLLSTKIRNAPANVLRHLIQNFEFILCEPSISTELCDAQRGCSTCKKWAASQESVTCARCKSVFHLSCLDPPLSQKPKVGYSWSCAPCSKAHDDEVESYMETGVAPTKRIESSTVNGKGKEKEKEKVAGADDKGKGKEIIDAAAKPWTMTNGWPFRYFGMHTQAYTIFDSHDSLYPRASTRLGNKFQAVVPNWDAERGMQDDSGEGAKQYFVRKSKAGIPAFKEKGKKGKGAQAAPERGEEDAVDLIFRPGVISDATADDMVASVKKLPVYKIAGVDLIDRGLSILTREKDEATALETTAKVTQKELRHAVWTEEERRLLLAGVAIHGNDIEEIVPTIPKKKTPDVVKRYYIVLGHSMQEDLPQQPEEKLAAAQAEKTAVQAQKSAKAAKAASKGSKAKAPNVSDDEDEGSLCGAPQSAAEKRGRICAVCETKTSSVWYLCPDNVGSPPAEGSIDAHIMCGDCGVRWRHYGIQYAPSPEEAKVLASTKPPVARKGDKGESEEKAKEKKKSTTASNSRTPTPAPPPPKPVIPAKPCVLCRRIEPKTSLVQCVNCTLAVHAACYGVGDIPEADELWMCDLCDKQNQHVPIRNPQCVLCPAPTTNLDNITALDCLKITERKKYIHLLCAIWHPDLSVTDSLRLQPVEGIATISSKRRQQQCHLCGEKDIGAYIKCEDCSRHFHVSCAWTAGYKFAFEIRPLKKKRAKEVIAVSFKDEEGSMTPCIWCPDHHFTHIDRVTYDLGQKDAKTKLTALQTFLQAEQQARAPDTFPILRQARRLDNLVQPVLAPAPPPQRSPSPPPVVVDKAEPHIASKKVKAKVVKKKPSVSILTQPAVSNKVAPSLPNSTKVKGGSVQDTTKTKAPVKTKNRKPPAKESMRVTPPPWRHSPEFDDVQAPLADPFVHPRSLLALLNTTEADHAPGVVRRHSFASPSPPIPVQPPTASPLEAEGAPSTQAHSSTSAAMYLSDPNLILPPLPPITPELIAQEDLTSTAGYRRSRIESPASGRSKSITPPSSSNAANFSQSARARESTSQDTSLDSSLDAREAGAESRHQSWVIKLKSRKSSPNLEAGSSDASVHAEKSNGSSSVAVASSDSLPAPVQALPSNGASRDLSASHFLEQDDIQCTNCGTAVSPMFRRDSQGQFICNACGLYYKSHGHHRPTNVVSRGMGNNRIAKRKAAEVEDGLVFVDEAAALVRAQKAKTRLNETLTTCSPLTTSPVATMVRSNGASHHISPIMTKGAALPLSDFYTQIPSQNVTHDQNGSTATAMSNGAHSSFNFEDPPRPHVLASGLVDHSTLSNESSDLGFPLDPALSGL